jgi:hypothetical protein
MTPHDLWLNGAPPPALPSLAELIEYGDLVAFERVVCQWLTEWKPLAALFAQDRPNIVTYADHATLDDVVNAALSAVGMYIVADLENAVKKSSMKQAFVFNPFNFMVTVTENPLLNRDTASGGTGMTCKRCASLIAKAFEGMTIGNGCASLKGITFPSVGDGQQNAVVTFSTQLVVTLDDLLA